MAIAKLVRRAAAAALLFGAGPAAATGGYSCRTIAPEGVTLDVVIGTGIRGGVAAATLRHGHRTFSSATGTLAIGQSWLDHDLLLLDLYEPAGNRPLARLKTGVKGKVKSRHPMGTLVYGDRTWRIACRPSD